VEQPTGHKSQPLSPPIKDLRDTRSEVTASSRSHRSPVRPRPETSRARDRNYCAGKELQDVRLWHKTVLDDKIIQHAEYLKSEKLRKLKNS
jgi:hypothetical protein